MTIELKSRLERDFIAAEKIRNSIDPLFVSQFAKNEPMPDELRKNLRSQIADLIDGTLLSPIVSAGSIEDLGSLAVKEKLRGICVPSIYLEILPHKKFMESETAIATVVNFPNGYMTLDSVLCETEKAVRAGATEIDFVQPLYQVKNQAWRRLEDFSRTLTSSFPGIVFKSILETSYLSIPEIQTSVRCQALAGVHIIKTNTGFGPRGASVEDIQTIRNTLHSMGLGKDIGIKASGGISDFRAVLDLVYAGATRIGTSKAQQILGV